MKKVIFYLPYELRSAKSGSGVRPQKILKAFQEYTSINGLELIEIHGNSVERKKKIKEFKSKVNPNDVLFCYMENSTLPYWLTDQDHIPRTPFLEYLFFEYLKKNRILIGLFYRDVYWKFDEYSLKGLKRIIMRSIYRIEHLIFNKYGDHFFLPSNEMNKYVDFPHEVTSNLPPGGENLIKPTDCNVKLNIIYVGGISERYGLKEMLEAVALSYISNKNLVLHLVCREEECKDYELIFDKYKNQPWLNIYHAHGEQLAEIYTQADIAIIPIQKNIYNDFAVPVKLFEYMSYGLPIISTNCDAQSAIVKEFNIGVVVDDSAEGLKEGIEFFLSESNRKNYSENVELALLEKNMWIHRVEKIASVLKRNEIN